MKYEGLYIHGLEVLNPRVRAASYGPLDVARKEYIPRSDYFCTRCNRGFSTQQVFAKHLWDEHPTKAPQLFIGSRQLTSTRTKIRNEASFQNLIALNSESITLNGELVTEEELNRRVRAENNHFFQIEIINEGVTNRFELDVKLVSDAEIQAIDQIFFDCFGKAEFTNKEIDTFIRLTSQFSSAKDYIDGLVSYLIALQVKSGKAGFTAYEHYPDKLAQALTTLSDFTNPLAEAICDLSLFMNNALSDISLNSPVAQLNSATQFLLVGDSPHSNQSKTSNDIKIPVDNATHIIIQLINEDFIEARSLDKLEQQTSAYIKAFDFSPADKDKVNLILFRKALAEKNKLMQKKYAKRLKQWDEIEKVVVGYE